MTYTYMTLLNQYRNNATDEFLTELEIREYVQEIIDAGIERMSAVAADLGDQLTPDGFMTVMKLELKTTTLQQALLGRGGRDQMTKADWGSVGRQLRLQYRDLRRFQADLETKPVSLAEVRRRLSLYFQKTREAYERANAKAYGLPPLPAYPGDLTSQCKAGCRCHWRIDKLGEGRFQCFWENDPEAETCETCVGRRAAWYPLEVVQGVIRPFTMIKAEAHTHDLPSAQDALTHALFEGVLTS